MAAVEGGYEGLGDREEREAGHRDDEGEQARDEHLHHAALLEAQDVQILPASGPGLQPPEAVVERGHQRQQEQDDDQEHLVERRDRDHAEALRVVANARIVPGEADGESEAEQEQGDEQGDAHLRSALEPVHRDRLAQQVS